VTSQMSDRTFDTYCEKLLSLNSLSVMHAIYALRVVLEEFDQLEADDKQILDEMLQRTYENENSVRALPEGNKFGLEHIEMSKKLLETFIAIQSTTVSSDSGPEIQAFEHVLASHRVSLANYLLRNLPQTRSRSFTAELIAEFLVTVDSQYTNPVLFPNKVYIVDEIADRAAAFALAAFVLTRFP